MVDSRDKGARAETVVRDLLRKHTGLQWERVPGSGALNEKHQMKGDLYIPGEKNHYCVEVKHYKDDHLTSALLTGKNPQLIDWWRQAARQGVQVSKTPLLIYKYDRSKVFAAYETMPTANYRYMFINVEGFELYTALLEDYLQHEQPKFIA